MKEYTKNLGKVVMTPKGAWSIEKEYEILDIVHDSVTDHAYISKQEVPSGVDLSDSRYWMPLNVSGYSDSNVITLNSFNEDGEIQSYTLEEAIKTINDVGRKSGAILIFYNNNVNRLDITTGCWEIWQFNSINIYDWENLDAWVNVYYNYNKFVGWYAADNTLNKEIPNPDIGCYAFVGNIYNEAFVYRCDVKNRWTKTNQKAQHYIKVVFGDNVVIGDNGRWWQDGVDTNIPVSVKGDNGLTPYLRWSVNNQIEYSYDNINWYILSNKFNTNIKIKDYVSSIGELPNNIELGTVYGVGPVYTEDDVEQINPIYNIYVYTSNGWVNNGGFNSISAGIVQDLGDSETEIISQKGVTNAIKNIGSNVESDRYIYSIVDVNGNVLLGIDKKGNLYWANGIPTHIKNELFNKVDKKEGHSLIQTLISESLKYINSNYIKKEIDNNNNILSYVLLTGETIHNTPHIFNDDVVLNSLSLSNKAASDIILKINKLDDILSNYPYSKYLPKIAKLKKPYDDYFKGKRTTKPLNMIHFSDIHGDGIFINNLSIFKKIYSNYIDDVYLTGDIVKAQFPDDISFLNETENKFLLVIGNHDSWKKNQVPVEVVSEKEVYDKFFKSYISDWNVVQPENAELGKCYYFKDYINSEIRVIVINCMHDSEEQLNFISNTLYDAKARNYSIVIMSHYTADFTQGIDVTFDTIDYNLLGGDYGTFNPKVADILETFIDNGGKFIAWIGGHYHIDMFGYMLNHPRLLQINIESASGRTGNDGTDTLRYGSDVEAFNIISFDTAMGFIKILRIGDNTDRHLRNKNVIVYDYINKKIISNY